MEKKKVGIFCLASVLFDLSPSSSHPFLYLHSLSLISLFIMSEPSKREIQEIFKKLRSKRENKVRGVSFVHPILLTFNACRFALTVVPRIPLGRL